MIMNNNVKCCNNFLTKAKLCIFSNNTIYY